MCIWPRSQKLLPLRVGINMKQKHVCVFERELFVCKVGVGEMDVCLYLQVKRK